MAIKLVKLTSIITATLVVLMGVTWGVGLSIHNFGLFFDVVDFTSSFLLIVGIWYLLAPPHRAVRETLSKKTPLIPSIRKRKNL